MIQDRAKDLGYKGVGVYDASMAYFMTSAAASTVAFEEGVRGLADDKLIGEQSLWGLKDYLKTPAEYDQAIIYALARHTVFMNAKKGTFETNMDLAEAEYLLEEVERHDPDQAERFTKFARGLAQFGNNLLLMQAEAGVMSLEDAETMIDYYGGLNYFPLHRVQERPSHLMDGIRSILRLKPKSTQFLGASSGIVNLPNPHRGRSKHGSSRQIIDPIDAMIAKTFLAYQTAIQARMIIHLTKTVDPDYGGVGGFGGVFNVVDPKTVITSETIENMLTQLMDNGIMSFADKQAMYTAYKIKQGAKVDDFSLEVFANRHGLDFDAPPSDLEYLNAAKKEPDPMAFLNIYNQSFVPDAQSRVVRVNLPMSKTPIMAQLDQDLYDTVTGMSQPELEMFGHGARAAGRVFKTGAVGISTVFGMKNLVNDIQEGFAKQKHVKGTLKSVYAPFAAVGIYAASKALAKMGVQADSTNQTKVKIAKWFDEGLTGKLNISDWSRHKFPIKSEKE